MSISRRKFLRLAPASVGAVALGAAVLPKSDGMTLAELERKTRPVKIDQAFIRDYEKGIHKAFTFPTSAVQTYYIPNRKIRRVFGFGFA